MHKKDDKIFVYESICGPQIATMVGPILPRSIVYDVMIENVNDGKPCPYLKHSLYEYSEAGKKILVQTMERDLEYLQSWLEELKNKNL